MGERFCCFIARYVQSVSDALLFPYSVAIFPLDFALRMDTKPLQYVSPTNETFSLHECKWIEMSLTKEAKWFKFIIQLPCTGSVVLVLHISLHPYWSAPPRMSSVCAGPPSPTVAVVQYCHLLPVDWVVVLTHMLCYVIQLISLSFRPHYTTDYSTLPNTLQHFKQSTQTQHCYSNCTVL